jgi:NADPH2:quinone reductase
MRLLTGAPVPSPGRDEVLVRVAAAGVDFADLSKACGTFRAGPRPPYVAGFEAAGEVVAVGEAVTGPRPGTCVIGVGDGGFRRVPDSPGRRAKRRRARCRGWSRCRTTGSPIRRRS